MFTLELYGQHKDKGIMYSTDTTTFQKFAKKKIPELARPLGKLKPCRPWTRRVPIAATRCRYCKTQIVVFGDKKEYSKWFQATLGNRGVIEHVKHPSNKSLTKIVPKQPERPCHVCMRDLFHYKRCGKYPDRSILWELRLVDRSLR